MSEMNDIECTQCGGELEPDGRTGIPKCIYCGWKKTTSVDEYSYELKEIVTRRQLREFTNAEELCTELIRKHPESSEAYWQMLLITFGVVYVTEERVAKPTFFFVHSYDESEGIAENEFCKKAIYYARSNEDGSFYSTKAKELDTLLKEFFKLEEEEKSYDIFISFKKNEEKTVDGRKEEEETEDCKKGREIYEYFTKQGYKVFYSPESIENAPELYNKKFEPRILKALKTAQAMILLGTKGEYTKATWVESEWKRYLYLIEKNHKKSGSLILAYKDVWPKDLHGVLKDLEMPNVDVGTEKYLEKLETYLTENIFPNSKKTKNKELKIHDFGEEEQDFGNNGGKDGIRDRIQIGLNNSIDIIVPTNEDREIDTAKEALKNGYFKTAIDMCNDVLEKNPHSARAYLIRIYAKLKIGVLDEDEQVALVLNIHEADDEIFSDFEKFIECASPTEVRENIDLLISALEQPHAWEKQKKLFSFLSRCADDTRLKRMLQILKVRSNICIEEKDFLNACKIFESAREIFLDDREFNMTYTYEHAERLLESGQFSLARPHFENLAGAKKKPEFYFSLLRSRLGVVDISNEKIKLNITKNEDGNLKKTSELNIDEIIFRTLICDIQNGEQGNRQISELIEKSALYQIPYNKKYAGNYVSLIADVYEEFDRERLCLFLLDVADQYLKTKSFENAAMYYGRVVTLNGNSSRAHWGLLKCRLMVLDDNELAKKGALVSNWREFKNANNSADEATHNHYMEVLYKGIKTRDNPFRDAYLTYTVKQRRAKRILISFASLLFAAALAYTIIGIQNPLYYNERTDSISGRNMFFDFVYKHLTVSEEKIGEAAFENSSLKTVVFESTVKKIDKKAFANCTDMEIAKFSRTSKGVYISERAFENCSSLTELEIYNVYEIGSNAFEGCVSLNRITLVCGSNVEISDNAFSGLNSEVVILIPTYQKEIAAELQEKNPSVKFELFTFDAVQECIYYIDKIGDVTLGDTSLLLRAKYAYESLSPALKVEVSNSDKLKNSLNVYDTLMSIYEIGEVTLESEQAIIDAESKYSDLSAILQTYIYNYDVLVDARAIYDVMYSIDSIGEVTEEKEDKIYNILTRYESLTEAQKESVSNYASLMSAIFDVDSIMAEIIVKRINEIENMSCDIGHIELAFELYNSLKDSQKALVTNYSTLETKINEYGKYFNMFTYVLLEDGTYSISALGNKPSGMLIIPDSYNGVPITTIAPSAFAGAPDITSIKISDNVTTIGFSAFKNCNSLENVNIGNGVTTIGYYAFCECNSLTSITIPDSVVSIGIYAFKSCGNLKSITIGNSVTNIGEETFYECNSLTSITIPDSVVSIGASAFYSCDNLTSVTIGNGANTICYSAFKSCDNLKSIVIGNGVTSIGKEAFYECNSLTSITIPDSVVSIGASAFYSCDNLKSVAIGNGVTSIGKAVFYECNSLTSIYIEDIAAWCEIHFDGSGSNPLEGANLYLNGNLVTNLVIPDRVTSIGDYAFLSCLSITSVTIGKNVTSIGNLAFADCPNLTSVTLGESVASIGSMAFAPCGNLTSIKYRGSPSEWASISKGNDWCEETSCTIIYNYTEK